MDLAPVRLKPPRLSASSFARRALVAAAVFILAALVLAILWYASSVLLLLFAAILAGVFLRSLSALVSHYTALSPRWSLAAVVLAILALTALIVWLLAPNLIAQGNQLSAELPRALRHARTQLADYGWARRLLDQAPGPADLASGNGSLISAASGLFYTTLNALVNLVIVLVAGLYLAADPGLYTNGLVRLVPPAKRRRAREVLGTLGEMLRWWLIGRFSVMAVNGALTTVALWLLGIPLAFTLGLLTGILNFIPNIGPILAGIPAVLIAFMEGPRQAFYVLLLYIAIQSLEGYVLTPLVQHRTVSLPPAVIILSQVLLGVLLGTLGVLLATPLAASVMVLVKMLYVEDTLGDAVDVSAEGRA
jgi:predicted PurR-regulated permease PerM